MPVALKYTLRLYRSRLVLAAVFWPAKLDIQAGDSQGPFMYCTHQMPTRSKYAQALQVLSTGQDSNVFGICKLSFPRYLSYSSI